jgi:uncharacterized protein YggE
VPASAVAQDRTVTVNGSATQQVPNDTAGLGFNVAKERSSRAAALRIVAVRLHAVIAAVGAVPGVGAGDVTTGRISIRKVIRDKRTVYKASEGISVTLHQPDRAGEMVSAAVAAGATGTSGPRFFPGDPALAYESTLLAAFDQARDQHRRRLGSRPQPTRSWPEGRRGRAGTANEARVFDGDGDRPRRLRPPVATA